jgi:pimeloyl-[acyl-carrier protein] synthase
MIIDRKTNCVDFDKGQFLLNPYPFYEELRRSNRPYWLKHTQSTSSDGVFLFSSYANALSIFKESNKSSKNIRSIRPEGYQSPFDLNLLFQDGRNHLQLRRLIADFFSIQTINTLEIFIEETADTLIQEMKEKESIDLITDFSEPLPLLIIAKMIGIPNDDLKMIRQWSRDLGDGFDSFSAQPDTLIKQKLALNEFIEYIDVITSESYTSYPNHSLLFALGQYKAEGKISHEYLVGMIGFLLFAGHETTINLIGNGLWLLLNNQESWSLLKKNPELMPDAIEEILRFESPEQRTSFRIAIEPIEINGFTLNIGDQFGAIIGSANRDPLEFIDPDKFNIMRKPNRHLAFGLGIHMCLGKSMARREAVIAIQRLIALCPKILLTNEFPSWRPNSFFRGLAELPAKII